MDNKHEALKKVEITRPTQPVIGSKLIKARTSSLRKHIFTTIPFLAVISSQQGCTLDRNGENLFASNQGGTAGEAGIEGGAGMGGNPDAGTGGSAGTAGEGGTAGKGGSAGEGGTAGSSGCTPQEEICDGLDNDCDNQIDEDLTPPNCQKTEGVCATPESSPVCEGVNGWSECDYGSDYEQGEEQTCDGLDNDCDGETDEMGDLINHVPTCDEPDRGVCTGATLARTCENGQWSECDYGPDYEQGEEQTCDGLDNNCDSTVDNPCAETVYGTAGYEQLLLPDDNTFTPLDGTTADDVCETTNTFFKPVTGNRLIVWLDEGANEFTLNTVIPPTNVKAGCSLHPTDCPDSNELWNDNLSMGINGSVQEQQSGDSYSYTHNGVNCSKHTFILDW